MAWVVASAAQAVPLYLGSARSSAVSGPLISVPASVVPVDESYAGCIGNACYDMAVHADIDRLEAQARSRGPYVFQNIATVETLAEAFAFGRMTLTADFPGAPALVPVNVTLRLQGDYAVDLSGLTSGWARMRLALGAGTSSAQLSEHAPGQAPPETPTFNFVRTGPDTVVASLVLPLGDFNWSTLLTVDEHVFTQLGSYDASSHFSVSFIEGPPVFTLPAGYHLWSTDFGIEDNRFCPIGCSAVVPEPSTIALLALAWAWGSVGTRRRRRRRPGCPSH